MTFRLQTSHLLTNSSKIEYRHNFVCAQFFYIIVAVDEIAIDKMAVDEVFVDAMAC
jgi:hypothetical protein